MNKLILSILFSCVSVQAYASEKPSVLVLDSALGLIERLTWENKIPVEFSERIQEIKFQRNSPSGDFGNYQIEIRAYGEATVLKLVMTDGSTYSGRPNSRMTVGKTWQRLPSEHQSAGLGIGLTATQIRNVLPYIDMNATEGNSNRSIMRPFFENIKGLKIVADANGDQSKDSIIELTNSENNSAVKLKYSDDSRETTLLEFTNSH